MRRSMLRLPLTLHAVPPEILGWILPRSRVDASSSHIVDLADRVRCHCHVLSTDTPATPSARSRRSTRACTASTSPTALGSRSTRSGRGGRHVGTSSRSDRGRSRSSGASLCCRGSSRARWSTSTPSRDGTRGSTTAARGGTAARCTPSGCRASCRSRRSRRRKCRGCTGFRTGSGRSR